MDLPGWAAGLPRVPFVDGPTPLTRLERLSAALGGRATVWVKREDLLPLAFGGNKLRNLEFLVGAALADGADTLVTAGRRWSNHCRLAAAAGARVGLRVELVLSGPPLPEPGPNERLCRLLGAAVSVAPTDERSEREALLHRVVERLEAEGRRPALLGIGGSDEVGAVGQVLAGLELARQCASLGVEPSAVVVATSSGGTQAGLLVGLALAGLSAAVVGIAVAHPAADCRPTVERLAAALAGRAGLDPARLPDPIVEDGWLGPAYGLPSAEGTAAAALLARTEGLLTDPIYTAKALAGLLGLVRRGALEGDVVFWHSGGLPGLFEPLAGPGEEPGWGVSVDGATAAGFTRPTRARFGRP